MRASFSRVVRGVALVAVSFAPVAAQQDQVHTDRPGARVLPLPKAADVFHFVVYGDRTTGPREGIKVLEQAVADTNLLDPDLVLTVGDLVQGYNTTPDWLAQAREYKAVMDRLKMRWFPVAGNHDVYWRGAGRPPGEHEGDYEQHFGPLWYAFEHKRSWFVVLYSDEGDPATGEKTFSKPAAQRMSKAQFEWLRGTLQKARGAEHVFVFLHHPRWLKGGYGDDWDRVHELLVQAGNVRAVFAGHIHRMRYDGVKDGIEYFTLAATGGELAADVPRAGFLHHLHVVTVRKSGIAVAALPVGAVMDPRKITGEVSADVGKLAEELRPKLGAPIALAADASLAGTVSVAVKNPAGRPIEITWTPRCRDGRWVFGPDHQHQVVPPGESRTIDFLVRRESSPVDAAFALPEAGMQADYLGEGLRISLPEQRLSVAVLPGALAEPPSRGNGVLALDGKGCVAVDAAALALPQGPFTVEGWCRGGALAGRRGFINKTENSDFGLFVSDGVPQFSVFLGARYVEAKADAAVLADGAWHHLAGVWDGAEVRLCVDGRVVARTAGAGERRTNELPLFIGADPDKTGQPVSHLDGLVDEVRISKVARYAGATFTPQRRCEVDADTVLLLHCDADLGPWVRDASASAAHGRRVGSATCRPEPEAERR